MAPGRHREHPAAALSGQGPLARPRSADADRSGRRRQVDAVSFFLHELGHAFGFNGWGDFVGAITSPNKSVYDTYVVQKDGAPYFTGPEAKAVHGGDVPLSGVLNNYHHYSHGPTDGLDHDMMQGSTYSPAGFRWYLDSIDLAMFRDLGITTVAHPIADVGGSSFYGFAAADLMQGGVGPDGGSMGGPAPTP